MIRREIPIILPDGSDESWRITYSADGPPYELFLEDIRGARKWAASGDDLYSCLLDIRAELERLSIFLRVNGSRIDARPSPMLAQMAGGYAVYLLNSRRILRKLFPTRIRHKIVNTFDPAPKEEIGTIEEQDRFFREYIGKGEV